MSELLEALMLVCFGCSWPMSLMKNIRSGTAKGMSLPFIILIITGYLAGIAAKILAGNYGYILLVYAVNLLVVSANLAVYFINLRKDHLAARREKEASSHEHSIRQRQNPLQGKRISAA